MVLLAQIVIITRTYPTPGAKLGALTVISQKDVVPSSFTSKSTSFVIVASPTAVTQSAPFALSGKKVVCPPAGIVEPVPRVPEDAR
jgi:hypothetical protein